MKSVAKSLGGDDEFEVVGNDPLARARSSFSAVWDYSEPNERVRGKPQRKGVVTSLNKTIAALLNLPRFRKIGLRRVKDQFEARKSERQGLRGSDEVNKLLKGTRISGP